jgi:hypothetical protein
MARIKNGILGGYRGKLGNTIGQVYRGVEVVRALPQSVANPNTPAQQEHRTVFADLARLLSGANNCIQYSVLQRRFQYNGFNAVLHDNFRNAVSKDIIDLSALNFGTFYGRPLDNLQVLFKEGVDEFYNYWGAEMTWVGCDNGINATENDQIMVVCVVVPKSGKPFVAFSQFIDVVRGATDTKNTCFVPLVDILRAHNFDEAYVFNGVVYSRPIEHERHPGRIHNPREVINIPATYPAPSPLGIGVNQQPNVPAYCNTMGLVCQYSFE